MGSIKQRTIPFFNYPALFKMQEKEIMETLHDVMSRGAYILQRDLEQFEENIKELIRVKDVLGVMDLAIEMGFAIDKKKLVKRLRETGFRISDKLYRRMLL